VFLGKYAAYTVSMAFLKEVDSTRRSGKKKRNVSLGVKSKVHIHTKSLHHFRKNTSRVTASPDPQE
jgi:hypothetical protein